MGGSKRLGGCQASGPGQGEGSNFVATGGERGIWGFADLPKLRCCGAFAAQKKNQKKNHQNRPRLVRYPVLVWWPWCSGAVIKTLCRLYDPRLHPRLLAGSHGKVKMCVYVWCRVYANPMRTTQQSSSSGNSNSSGGSANRPQSQA